MKFEPTFKSLYQYKCPDWFLDAKLGIWSHWGPQSVPMYGDWYARHMYIEGTQQYIYHLRKYGHPSKFGYKDICALWKAEKFDPDRLIDKYVKAGAGYFVAQAMHHDHFFNFPSKYNSFNSVEMGPEKDICGLWKKAADKRGLPFGLTEHLGASFSWWGANKGADSQGPFKGIPYDGSDPAYKDFYYENQQHYNANALKPEVDPWYTRNENFRKYWLNVMKELIDLYKPDLLYSDGALPFGAIGNSKPEDIDFQQGLEAVAYLYNTSAEKYGENRAVYNQKDRRPEIYNIGILDIEKSQLPDIRPEPWQTDTCIGNWFYDVREHFKKPGHIIEMLVDIISKNGSMLLNILQLPDGSLDEETEWILDELAGWFNICGEAVRGSRPWRISGEGDSKVVINGFEESAVAWNPSDFRFVQKNGFLYAFVFRTAENGVSVIKSLTPGEAVRRVRLLGYGNVEFAQNYGVLTVKLPSKMPSEYVNCLEIDFA